MTFSGNFNTVYQSFNLSASLQDLPVGPLVFEKLPQEPNLMIGWNLSVPSFKLILPPIKVVSRENGDDKIIPAWPNDGIIIDPPDMKFDGSFYFTGSNSFGFAGYENSWEYHLKRQKNNEGKFALSATFDGSQTFFGSSMDLYFNAQEIPQANWPPQVNVIGSLRGEIHATICPICSPVCSNVRIWSFNKSAQVTGDVCSFEGSDVVGAPCSVKFCDPWGGNCITFIPQLCVWVRISPTELPEFSWFCN